MKLTWVRGACGVALLLTVAACARGGQEEYANDADTGAAAPAANPDMSTARMQGGPDSTLGVGGRTGEPGVTGDTMGSRGRTQMDTSGRIVPDSTTSPSRVTPRSP